MSEVGAKVWREGSDIDPPWHTGPFWFAPDDRRVAIMSGKGELAGLCCLGWMRTCSRESLKHFKGGQGSGDLRTHSGPRRLFSP